MKHISWIPQFFVLVLAASALAALLPAFTTRPARAAPAGTCPSSQVNVQYTDRSTIDLTTCAMDVPAGGYMRLRRENGPLLATYSVSHQWFQIRDSGLQDGTSYNYILEYILANGEVNYTHSITGTTGPAGGRPVRSLTWSGGEYIINRDLYLEPGVTLTIASGTRVSWAGSAIILQNGGSLIIQDAILQGSTGSEYASLGYYWSSDHLAESSFSMTGTRFQDLAGVNINVFGVEAFSGNQSGLPAHLGFVAPRGDFNLSGNSFPSGSLEVDLFYTDQVTNQLLSFTAQNNHLQSFTFDGCTALDADLNCNAYFEGAASFQSNRFHVQPAAWFNGLRLQNMHNPSLSVQDNQSINGVGQIVLETQSTAADRHLVKGNLNFSIQLRGGPATLANNQAACMGYNTYAIQLVGDNSQVTDNLIANCPSQFAIGLGGENEAETAVGNLVSGNTVKAYMAVLLQHASQNEIRGNTFRVAFPNQFIALFQSTQNTFVNNSLISDFGVPVASDDFCANTWNGSLLPGANIVGGHTLGGNYWSNYTGSDPDGDGVGNTPFLLGAGCGDQYPLMAADLPELVPLPFTLDPASLQYTGTQYILPLDVLVDNAGIAPAASVNVKFSDSGGWSEIKTIPAILPGESQPVHVDWDLTPLLLAGNGLAEARLTLQVDPAQAIPEWNDANNAFTAAISLDARPRILEVRPEYTLAGSYFLASESVPNRLTVFADWNGSLPGTGPAPYGEVHFDLNGVQSIEPGLDWGAAHVYDLGSDFNQSLQCANNLLRVAAVLPLTGGELTSLQTVLQPTVLPFPGWVQWVITHIPGSDTSFETRLAAPLVEYQYDFNYPDEPFEATWIPPAWVPFLGGEELGILPTQGGFNLNGKSNGLGSVSTEGATGLGLAALTAQGRLFGSGQTTFTCDQSLDLTRAELGFEISASVEKEIGLVDLIPAVRAAEDWPLVGRIIRWVNQAAQVKGSLTPAVSVLTLFEEQNDELAFVNGNGTGSLQARAELAVSPVEDLSASVYGGGQPYITLQVPAAPGYLKETGIHLFYGAGFQAWSFETEYERRINCQYPGVCAEPEESRAASAPVWRVISRPQNGAPYAQALQTPLETAAGEEVLLSNIYPRSQPALALNGSLPRLAYIHDDPADPAGRGTEIYLLSHDGTAWSTPAAVTADQQPDYAPALAVDGSGRTLLLWEHSTLAAGVTPQLDQTFAQSLEIQACAWDGSACQGSSLLTDNAAMDFSPRLSRLTNGDVLAFWQSGDGADLMGTSLHPLTFTTATWNHASASWGLPQPVLTGLFDVTGVAFAADSATLAALVYARDMDGDLLTPNDSELFYSTFDGAAWSAPARLTTDRLPDTSPALACESAGVWHLAWLRAQQLVEVTNWNLADLQTLGPASQGGYLDVQLLRAGNGSLAITWQAMDAGGPNPAYRIFDPAHASWSSPRPLFSDSATESAVAAAFGSNGSLYLAYQKTALLYRDESVEVQPGVIYTIHNIPEPGPSDLAFLEHAVASDLDWQSLSVTPANPQPGDTLTLTGLLRNAGDLTIAAPQAAFYADDVLMGSLQTLPALPAGQAVSVTAAWQLPAEAASAVRLRAAADPSGQVVEMDETNNQAALWVNRPNLQVEILGTRPAGHGLDLTARLLNSGHSATLMPFNVTLRADDAASGALLASAEAPALLAGETFTLTFNLPDAAVLAGVNLLWVTADSTAVVSETDEADNSALTSPGYLPDLAIRPDEFSTQNGFEALVRNTGLTPAEQVRVEVRSGSLSGELISESVIPAIPAGASAVVPIHAPAGSLLFVHVDPLNAVVERDESNNLAVIGAPLIRRSVYLPAVLR